MTFLNPLVLFGLVAAAIPVLIHLFTLRKLRTIEFSSLQFLKELQKTRMRKLRIRQMLLLLLRTLIIVSVVLAFSRPALRGSLAGFMGTRATSTMAILLDDSPSMSARNERGILFTQAKDAASQILGLAGDDDHLYVERLSDVPLANTAPALDRRTAHEALQEANPSSITVSFRQALLSMRGPMERAHDANREIYIVTDGQATQLTASQPDSDSTAKVEPDIKVFLVRVPPGQRENVGAASAGVETQIVAVNKPVSVKALLRNFSESAVRNGTVSVYLDKARVGQQLVDLQPMGSAEPRFSILPKRRGMLPGYVKLEDDALEADNTRFFVVDVPGSINVIAVGTSPEDTRYPSLALTLAGDSSMAGVFSVRQSTADQLQSLDLSTYDVLILSGIRSFSIVDAQRIAQFVHGGGGLLVFPGDGADITNYNATLFATLGLPPAGPATPRVPPSVPGTGADRAFVSFDRIDYAHPLFAGLFDQTATGKRARPSVESPRIYRTIQVKPGAKGRTVISLTDGNSFLTEFPAGQGRVLLCSVQAGLGWSDFPVKAVFAPLMNRMALYLGSGTQAASPVLAGARMEVSVRLKSIDPADAYVFRSPSGIDERVAPRFLPTTGMASFTSGRATETGVYQLRRIAGRGSGPGDILQSIAVNIDPSESDLRPATDDETREFLQSLGVPGSNIRVLSSDARLDAAIQESRYGMELWRYFIGLAVVCALAEMAIGRAPRTETQEA